MKKENNGKGTSLSPEQVIAIMAKHGETINQKEAEIILETVRFFVKIVINQYLREGQEGS